MCVNGTPTRHSSRIECLVVEELFSAAKIFGRSYKPITMATQTLNILTPVCATETAGQNTRVVVTVVKSTSWLKTAASARVTSSAVASRDDDVIDADVP